MEDRKITSHFGKKTEIFKNEQNTLHAKNVHKYLRYFTITMDRKIPLSLLPFVSSKIII